VLRLLEQLDLTKPKQIIGLQPAQLAFVCPFAFDAAAFCSF